MANIVPLKMEHIDAIEEIERYSFKTPWSHDMLLEELDNPLANYYVIEDGTKVVAYMGYYRILDEAHITNIAVNIEYRQQGYAKELLTFVLNDMRENGAERTTLEVNEHNTPAISLYESFGFTLAGKRPKYYEGIDTALIYWLELKK